jgi:hypothetical protein
VSCVSDMRSGNCRHVISPPSISCASTWRGGEQRIMQAFCVILQCTPNYTVPISDTKLWKYMKMIIMSTAWKSALVAMISVPKYTWHRLFLSSIIVNTKYVF